MEWSGGEAVREGGEGGRGRWEREGRGDGVFCNPVGNNTHTKDPRNRQPSTLRARMKDGHSPRRALREVIVVELVIAAEIRDDVLMRLWTGHAHSLLLRATRHVFQWRDARNFNVLFMVTG